MFGLALGVFQMFELVQIFENWAISPKIPHFQFLLKDLIDSLAPPAHTHTPCRGLPSLHGNIPTVRSTHNTCLGPETIRDCNHQPAVLES